MFAAGVCTEYTPLPQLHALVSSTRYFMFQSMDNLYELDVTTLDNRLTYQGICITYHILYRFPVNTSIYPNHWVQSYFVGNDIEHRSTTSSMILLLINLICPNVTDSISIVSISWSLDKWFTIHHHHLLSPLIYLHSGSEEGLQD